MPGDRSGLGTQGLPETWGRNLGLENRAWAELRTLSGSEDPVALGPVINGLSEDFQSLGYWNLLFSHLWGLFFTPILVSRKAGFAVGRGRWLATEEENPIFLISLRSCICFIWKHGVKTVQK